MDAIRIVEGDLRVGDLRIALVASRFNETVVERLVTGAVEALVARGAARRGLELVRVPGAFDLPPVVRRIAKSGRFDAVIALGAVIRGETAHFDYVAGECAAGLARIADETGVPVAFGVLTVETVEQGEARIDRAADAVRTALEMADLFARLRASAH